MTAKQYRAALDRLGLSQKGAARLFGADPRTSRRWALDEAAIPETVAMILRYLINTGTSPDDFEAASQ
jgi:hypothetical protein